MTALWQHLLRPIDYPAEQADWIRLVGSPRGLRGPHDWGLAMGAGWSRAGRRRRSTPLGELYRALVRDEDEVAGEILAILAGRFMRHIELHNEFDLACALPVDYISGNGDSTASLFARPGVDYPLAVRTDLLTWEMAAGPGAVASDEAMRLQGQVAGRRVLIVCDWYRFDRACPAVHVLRAGGASRVGVLALCAHPGDLRDL